MTNTDGERQVVRTIKIPVAEVVSGGSRNDFYRDLRSALKRCVAAMNRCLTECAVIDREAHESVARGAKVPKKPKTYTYPVLTGQFDGHAIIASSIARAAENIYHQYRFGILTGQKSLPTQRSCPLPLLHNTGAKTLHLSEDNQGNIDATLRLLGDTTYTVRLRGGSNYARQLRTIKQAVATGAVRDSKIWLDRRGVATLGIACKIPAPVARNNSGVLKVQTGRDAFIIATKEQDTTPFTINADHVKGWIAERKRRQQRLRQDRKSGASREAVKRAQAVISRNHTNKMRTFVQQVAAKISEYAGRRRVAVVEFDCTIKSYLGRDFPYFDLENKLMHKCEELGVEFVKATAEVQPAAGDEPHVYFDLGVDKRTGELRNVKIGKTGRKVGQRAKDDSRARDQEWVTLATHATTSAKLARLEKHYLAMFAEHKIDGEMFAREPVIAALREMDMLGNTGNIAQIEQYMEA